MDDQERLQALLARMGGLAGVNERTYQRLLAELDAANNRAGHDDLGRLKVAMFDARAYDLEAFELRNSGRYAIHPIHAALNRDTVHAADGHKVVCLFVNDTCDAAIVGELAARGVELITLRCAGYNNVDLQACRQRGIDVVHVPAYSPYAVAEHTVALMLMLNRHLHQAYQRNRTGYFVLDGLTGFDMRGKTVGIVGTGQIGQAAAEILLGFGCRVLAFDKFPAPRPGVDYVELDTLFRESDIITLHVPLFPETHHLINAKTIQQMKDGVMLINTSRGGLVDTRALIDGLKSGKVGFAGLDVYEEEAGVFFHNISDQVLTDDVLARLLTFNNVVITSHQAFLTREALANIADTTLLSIQQYQAGRRGEDLSYSVAKHGQ